MSYETRAIVDPAGWVIGSRFTDGPLPAPVPDQLTVPDLETAQLATQAKGLARLSADRRTVHVPQDDRRAWRLFRGRGRSGRVAYELLGAVRDLRRRCPDDVPGDVPDLPIPAPATLPTMPHAFAEVPGLLLRATVPDDLDSMAQAGIEGGLYAPTCPTAECGCTPPEAHAWLHLARRIDNADAWAMTWTFQGQPIQHQIIRQMRPGEMTYGYTVHLNRERPHWFWRELERPVIEGMLQAGATGIYSSTRSDRPDWIQQLRDNYGAEVHETHAKTTVLKYPLPTILSRFVGWPVRKTVGFDQTTGRVRVWEATAADLPAVRELARGVPVARRAIALRALEEWFHMDRATLLLGALDGVLRYARLIRPRRGTVGAVSHVGPVFNEPEQALVTAAIRTWAQGAGYTTLTSFIPESLIDNPLVQAQLARSGMVEIARHQRFKEPFVEVSDAV